MFPAECPRPGLLNADLLDPHSTDAALLSYISGFAALGFGVRCYQLALMKRNIFQSQSTVLWVRRLSRP